MIVSIDTNTVNEIATEATNLSLELCEAFNCLKPVIEHNDWNCYERDSINEMIILIKKACEKIKNNSESFANSLLKSSSAFEELEKKTPAAMQRINTSFAADLSRTTQSTSINGNVMELNTLKLDELRISITRILGGLPNPNCSSFKLFQYDRLVNPIDVVKPAPINIIGNNGRNSVAFRELSKIFKKIGIDKSCYNFNNINIAKSR